MKSPLGLEARLPVFELFKDALFLLWAKRSRLITMFLPIIVVLVVLDQYSSAMSDSLMASVDPEAMGGMTASMVQMMIVTILSMLLSILLATTVHRFSLQDSSHWPKNALRLPNRYDWRYLGRSVLISIVAAAVATFVILISSGLAALSGNVNKESMTAAMGLAMVPGIMVMLYIVARFSITLPEIAIGTEGSDMGRAWRMSKGNGSRLVIVVMALPLLVNIPFLLLFALENTLGNIIASFGVYSMTLISITVLSLSYQFLVEFYEPEESENVVPEADPKDDSSLDA